MNETILEIYADYYKVKKEKHNTHEEYVEAIKKNGRKNVEKNE